MNWIEKMIAEQCPNGVERVKVKDFANVGTGSSNGNEAEESGKYPFFVRSQIVKRKNDYEFDEEAIIIPGEGGIGDIFHYVNGKYALHQRVYRIHFTSNKVNVKFAYFYMMSSFKDFIMKKAVSATVTSIRKPMIEGFEIPLPPLSIQEEIVSVLDKFSELIEKTDEEIALRQKQYEYYREKLLTFEEGEVDEYEIQECCFAQSGGTPSKHNTSFWENGDIKWLGSTVCQNVSYIDTITDFITEEGLRHSSAKLLQPDTTLIALVGATIGKVAYLTFESAINQNIVGIYSRDTSVLMNKYIYYYSYLWYKDFMSLANGKLAMASLGFVRKLKIKYPPLSRQQEIVETLDKFETLISKLKEERELRQKQYEYYREKLLTF